MNIEIVRQKRKTLSLVVTRDGRVEARAPMKMETEKILQFAREKSEWIERKLKEIQDKINPEKNYVDGEIFEILGKEYLLTFYDGEKIGLKDDKLYFPKRYQDECKVRLGGWYKVHAKSILKKYLDEESVRLGLGYGKFKISTAKTRWGSCSSKNDICLNYRLMSAPEYVIRAVCAHELCHVAHKNHGKDYKRMLKNLSPYDKEADKWLKSHMIDGLGEG